MQELDRQLSGWGITLGDPSLSSIVRNDIVAKYEEAKLRKQQLEQDAQAERALELYVAGMLNAGINQETLGERAGIHRTYVGDVERGERNISPIKYVRFASALKVPCCHSYGR